MKQILAFLSTGLIFSFAACNSGEKQNEEAKSNDTTAASTTKTPEPPSFTPFTVTLVQHPVKNYDKWLPFYEGHDSVRKAYGLTELAIGRGLDNPNMIYLAFKSEDVNKAKEFSALPSLKETTQKAGVTKPPIISYLTVVRNDTSATEQKDRLMVAHHVKNFDAWLKVYDGEGKDTRAANGITDRGLARGVDDPNMVYVLFVVSDIKKAKARVNSPELKKLMTDAGVDGPPTINFYKIVR